MSQETTPESTTPNEPAPPTGDAFINTFLDPALISTETRSGRPTVETKPAPRDGGQE